MRSSIYSVFLQWKQPLFKQENIHLIAKNVIAIAGLSSVSEFEGLTIVQSQGDAGTIAASQPSLAIAVLEGVQADTLDSNSFAFA